MVESPKVVFEQFEWSTLFRLVVGSSQYLAVSNYSLLITNLPNNLWLGKLSQGQVGKEPLEWSLFYNLVAKILWLTPPWCLRYIANRINPEVFFVSLKPIGSYIGPMYVMLIYIYQQWSNPFGSNHVVVNLPIPWIRTYGKTNLKTPNSPRWLCQKSLYRCIFPSKPKL